MALGGILADIRYIYAYIGVECVEIITVFVSIFFTEPVSRQMKNALYRKKPNFKEQIWSSFQTIRENPRVINIILLGGILDMSASLIFFYGRRIFELLKMSAGNTGMIYTLYLLISALAAWRIHKTVSRYGEKRVIFIFLCLGIMGLAGFAYGNKLVEIGAFLLVGVVTGASYPLFSDYINKEIPSRYRATILSVNAACFSMLMIVFFPVMGWLADLKSLEFAFKIIVIPVGILFAWMIIVFLKPQVTPKKSNHA